MVASVLSYVQKSSVVVNVYGVGQSKSIGSTKTLDTTNSIIPETIITR